VLVTGTPETVAAEPRSYTGAYLKPLLERGQKVGAGVEKESVAAE
jgi:excinuclease ABC subunit A